MLGTPAGHLKRIGSLLLDFILVILLTLGINIVIMTPILDATIDYKQKRQDYIDGESEYYDLAVLYQVGSYGVFLDSEDNPKNEFIIDNRYVDMDKVHSSTIYKNYREDDKTIELYENLHIAAESFGLGTIVENEFIVNPDFTSDNPLKESEEYESFIADEAVKADILSLYNLAAEYKIGRVDINGNFFYDKDYYVSNQKFSESIEYKNFLADETVIAYMALSNELQMISVFAVVVDLLFATVIILYLPSLFFKRGKSLGKFIFRLAVISKDDYEAPQKNLFLRAFATFAIELSLVYIIMSYFISLATIALMIPFISLSLMLFTQRRITLHDAISGTKVVDETKSKIFNTLAERNAYVEEMIKKNENLPRLEPKTDSDIIDNLIIDNKKNVKDESPEIFDVDENHESEEVEQIDFGD